MGKECVYMIHTCNERKWYVEQYLIPSLLLQGVDMKHIIMWLDKEKKGNLTACLQSIASLPKEGSTWHLQDDVVISKNFKEITEKSQNYAPVVCGYCYYTLAQGPGGYVPPANMWYSFPCIKIDNKLAKDWLIWCNSESTKRDSRYIHYIESNKFDDTMFKEFLLNNYFDNNKMIYNLKPNIVDHIDYLIGGSIVNPDRAVNQNPAPFFEDHKVIMQLKDKLDNRHKNMRVAAYCGTRNLYKDMIPAIKSLLVNSNVDKIYLLIEDDDFPYPLPPQVETINVSKQAFFPPGGPNGRSRFTYMAMMRAALPFIFPEYDKILSLDIDTIVVQDISELWDIDLGHNYFAACVEPDRCIGGDNYDGRCRNYYNIGVTMYNLKELRLRKGKEVIQKLNEEEFPFVEQDVMSQLCDGNTITISNDYNCMKYSPYPYCGRSFNPKIIHYAGVKDWAEKDFPEVVKYREMRIGNDEFEF